jgi:topoisomerase IV subunit A
VQKAKLIERIAQLLDEKKLAGLESVQDESTDDIRIVLTPKSRTVEAELLMEQLFRQTDLETRVGLNLNVLDKGLTPKVMSLREALVAFLDHRREVLERRTRHRLARIAERLELLEGYLAVYLNIDKVIKIIRTEDEPKPKLMSAFKINDRQAEAILNMRLRALRKLEEMEIRREHENLTKERKELKALLASKDKQWKTVASEIKALKDQFGQKTELGRRRTSFAEAPEGVEVDLAEAMIEKGPVTIVLSEKGWIRAIRGHQTEIDSLSFKEGDRLKRAVKAQTTDTLLLFATNGRFYSLGADKLPGGRGHGEPFRLMIDIEEAADAVELFVHEPGRKLLVAGSSGHGFIVNEDEVLAMTRKGKQVLNVREGEEAVVVAPAAGDSVAVIGDNRKLLLFPLSELPEMPRGKGVRLQRYKDGGLADAKVFDKKEGLTYLDAAKRSFTLSATELRDWWGQRAQAGRLPPKGFPKSGKFGPRFNSY